MELNYRAPRSLDLPSVTCMVRAAFDRFVAPEWSVGARANFHDEVSEENLARAFASAFYCGVCALEQEIIGVVLFPSPRLVSLTFVSPAHVRRGIASTLLGRGVRYVEQHQPEISVVCLNATRNAMPFYSAQGFFPISPEFEHCGTVATRLALWLPYYDSLHGIARRANPAFNRTRRHVAATRSPSARRTG